MAIIFTYPSIAAADLSGADRLLISKMSVDGNPTKSLTISNLRTFLGAVVPANIVTGTGTTNRLARWTNGAGGVIGNSGISDDGVSGVKIPYAVDIENATSTANGIRFNHPAGGASGIVNMYYNGVAAGSRFVISRSATGGAEIELQSNGDVNINRLGNGNFLVGGEVTLDDYGAGTITGTPTFYLAVDVNGKVIEETSAGGIGGTGTIDTLPVFTAATTLGDSLVVSTSGGNGIGINMTPGAGSSATFRIESTGAGLTPDVMQLSSASTSCNIMLDQSGGLPFGYYGNACVAGGAATEMQLRSNNDLLFSSGGSTEHMRLKSAGDLQLPLYGSNTFTGTATFGLSVDANGNIIETPVAGYKSVQVFQWLNGTPVAYTNWTNGVASNIPFNATPLVERGTYSGTPANFAWTCVNNAGGTATQEAQFTLGANGAGTWQIDTCQHWFDQTNQVEIRVSFQFTSGGVTQQIDVIDEKSTELSGDKIFYGSLVREFVATDKIEVEVEFVSGGVNPFPSDSGNRPIEITFTKLV